MVPTNNSRPNHEEIQELLQEERENTEQEHTTLENNEARSLDFLYDVPLEVSVEVGRSKILIKDLLNMGEGYVIELNKVAGDPLDLYVNSRLIARGEAVMIGDKFGIRLTDVVSASDRLERLGK
ncbi:flagellar motor switch protein FliN [Desulfotalea psychrophila]|uniref:Flagellar motor switch protein FliN n=1 Tax=Desulfotalea psychrophila (strain LSv54 / DSM 12343) TaxID=177439 RepID=Q6AJS8_DESPS|nr:flagellar motor switch protein FliN [Desulfotalea psychrophila]CAG37398.1 probable flagellar motor switch protein (FliN) [Desulfotalea psychrophila LSv54]